MGGTGGGSGGGAGGEPPTGAIHCFGFEDMANDPTPGETGIAACRPFADVEFTYTGHDFCVHIPAQDAPVDPVSIDDVGDCCYLLSTYNCR